MDYRQLGRTDLHTSVIGFGASPFGDLFGAINPKEAERAVALAIDSGINFFDVAPFYGETLAEQRLGNALRKRRKEILLSTKCGHYATDRFDYSALRITASMDESLQRLRTDYVDLLLAHNIEFGDAEQLVDETIPAMRELQKQGKARFIGISAYPLAMLRRVAERAPVDVILTYCHYNPLSTKLETSEAGLMDFVRARGIGLINASPLHMGLLNGRKPPEWHPAPQPVRAAAGRFVEACQANGSNPATIALRFCIEQPNIATTLVGMATREEVKQNLEAMHISLSQRLCEDIASIAQPVAEMVWASGRAENN